MLSRSVVSDSLQPRGLGGLSMEFSRQEYWSGLPFPSSGDLPDLGIEPASLVSPALAGRFFTTSTTWEAPNWLYCDMIQKVKKKIAFC